MRLFEYEGKRLFKAAGLPVPIGRVISKPDQLDAAAIAFDATAVKVQVLSGQRGKAGGVKLCHGLAATKAAAAELLAAPFRGERVSKVLVEQYVDIEKEHYLAVAYDTAYRAPVLMARRAGGVDVETIFEGSGQMAVVPVDAAAGFSPFLARELLFSAGFEAHEVAGIAAIIEKLWRCFWQFDLRVAEINPLVRTKDGRYLADDAKVIVDESALFRQPLFHKRRVSTRTLTRRERAARRIDAQDHRGTAGTSFLDIAKGNVAILSSGGGASLAAFDAFTYAAQGRPFAAANFTEYSGNPPAEKVMALTRVVLTRPGLTGCWVVGGVANFTDIFETLAGFVDGLRTVRPKPRYPIVIRRGGPRTAEAFKMLTEVAEREGYQFILQTPETTFLESARTLIDAMTKHA